MHFADPREAREFLAVHPEVCNIELFLIDANGVPHGKLLHRDELLAIYESGRPPPSTVLGLTINGDDVEETGLVWDVGDADYWIFPLPDSLTLQPWRRSPTRQVQVSMHPKFGLPAATGDPRYVLQRVIHNLQAEGFHPVIAVGLEFYLFDRERDSDGRPSPTLQTSDQRPRATQVYSVYELGQLQPFLDNLYAACEAQGLPARTAILEYVPGQVETILQHRFDAFQAIDEGVRYKRLVRGVANRHGLQACFMTKPFADLSGNGLHLHVSLADAAGNNLFASEDPAGTPLLCQAIGRMKACLLESLALFYPNVNSPRRSQANSYAPLAPTWGINNRTMSLRVPGGPPSSRHIEHRICDADANPYLVMAALLAAVRLGIRERLDPGAPTTGNGYAQATQALPSDWLTALRALEGSVWAREALSEDFPKVYLAIKQVEYRVFMGEAGEQDWRWYLNQT